MRTNRVAFTPELDRAILGVAEALARKAVWVDRARLSLLLGGRRDSGLAHERWAAVASPLANTSAARRSMLRARGRA
jgi:hypothetical protein